MFGICYLLHFERPISSAHSCQHYIGWALDINARLAMHRAGKGARLTQVAVERGIGFEVVRTWPGTRELERLLKNSKNAPRLCPMCCQIHGRQPRTVETCVEQLTLPLDDFPPPPQLRPDWLEITIQREWRAAWAELVTTRVTGDIDDLL